MEVLGISTVQCSSWLFAVIILYYAGKTLLIWVTLACWEKKAGQKNNFDSGCHFYYPGCNNDNILIFFPGYRNAYTGMYKYASKNRHELEMDSSYRKGYHWVTEFIYLIVVGRISRSSRVDERNEKELEQDKFWVSVNFWAVYVPGLNFQFLFLCL